MEHPYLRVKKGIFSKNEKNFGKNLVESNICSTFALAIQKAVSKMSKRGVAQPGSAPVLGTGGRRFESCRPDFKKAKKNQIFLAFLVYIGFG